MTYIRAFALQARPSTELKGGPAKLHDYLNDAAAAPARTRRRDEGTSNTKESDLQHPGRRVAPKGYLHLHMLSKSHT